MKFLVFVLIFLPFGTLYSQPIEFYTDEESCDLKEIGFETIPNSLIFRGKRWLVDNNHSGCTVTVEKSKFESKFSMCFLTSINFFDRGYCTFRAVGKNSKQKYIFEFNDKATLNCRFTCIK